MHLKKISKLRDQLSLQQHSIPILLRRNSKHLRYVSYSIPLACALALLLLFTNLFVIDYKNSVYAEEGIETYATSANPTATLQISSPSLKDTVSPGSTSYISSQIDITAQDITDYALIISGPTNLNGTTDITGAGGKTGNNLTDNTWGYAWGNTSDADAGMTYNSLSSSGSTLASGKATSLDMSKKLTFAAKFAESAESGHYTASVNLSLTATPREVATGFNGIYDMQEMTAEVCNSATIGQTGSLEDIRDGSIYTVGKLSDGNCWMTRNLRITRETIKAKDSSNTTGKITSADSNVSANYEIPASTTDTFSDAKSGNYYTNQQVRASVDNDYGAYYSYNVATVNTAATASSSSATYDICPKGWRLPTGGSSGEFQALYNKWTTATWTTNNSKNGRWLGGASASAGGAFFPAAGLVSTSGLNDTGSGGDYWSSTINSATFAYYLSFYNSSINPATYYNRYLGYSVRCVAETRTLSDITKMQEMTPTICANTSIGATKTLTDSRDNSTYTVGKLSDGNCWMTQNLRIVNKTITSEDSNVSSDFTIPASATWTDTSTTGNHVYYGNDTDYGAYYTWYTAAAGTDASSYDICPKGWRLPTGGTTSSEFYALAALYPAGVLTGGSSNTTGWTTSGTGNKAGRWFGAENTTSGGAFFPAAGYMNTNTSSVYSKGTSGVYRASGAAHQLLFGSSKVFAADSGSKYTGLSVRCIAK